MLFPDLSTSYLPYNFWRSILWVWTRHRSGNAVCLEMLCNFQVENHFLEFVPFHSQQLKKKLKQHISKESINSNGHWFSWKTLRMKLVSIRTFLNSSKEVFAFLAFGIVGSENYQALWSDKIAEHDASTTQKP